MCRKIAVCNFDATTRLSHQGRRVTNSFQATRKHTALNKLLMPGDLGKPGVSESTLGGSQWNKNPASFASIIIGPPLEYYRAMGHTVSWPKMLLLCCHMSLTYMPSHSSVLDLSLQPEPADLFPLLKSAFEFDRYA